MRTTYIKQIEMSNNVVPIIGTQQIIRDLMIDIIQKADLDQLKKLFSVEVTSGTLDTVQKHFDKENYNKLREAFECYKKEVTKFNVKLTV